MKLDNITIQRIRDLPILDVADKLQLKYSSRGSWRKALCFCHDDHTPSLGINLSGNKWKCFSCGKGGNHIDLVMEHENLSFNDACEWLIREFSITVPQQESRKSLIEAIKSKLMNYNNENINENSINHDSTMLTTSAPYTLNRSLLEQFQGTSNEFTRALVNCNILTPVQMRHAAEVFHLSTADDNVIFWQIDHDNHIREGKVMYYQADAHRSHSRKPVTISWLLKKQKQLPEEWKAKYCLFGLHQLSLRHDNDTLRYDDDNCIIAIVESEKTAIICSELIPTLNWQSSINHKPSTINLPVIWMATGGKSNLSVQALQPVLNKRVILFPDTDTTGECYKDWIEIAKQANCSLPSQKGGRRVSITVSPLLERFATKEQKERKIDIADFIIETR